MLSPLEQFEIYAYIIPIINGIGITLSNTSLYLILNTVLLIIFVLLSISNLHLIATPGEIISEMIFIFLRNMTIQQAGYKGLIFLPLFITTFFFILIANIIGLLPLGFTVTSQIIITWTLAFSFNFGFLILGLVKNKLSFFNLFKPKGVPLVLMPLIFIIEIFSYLIRTFSLSVRLFANMMAGHTLLHIIASFVVMLNNPLIAAIPAIFIYAIFIMEFGIALLQTYVFVVLLNIYLKDALSPSH